MHAKPTSENGSRPTLSELKNELWNTRLFDADVWEALTSERESLRFWTLPFTLLLSAIMVLIVCLTVFLHVALAIPGAILLLSALARRRKAVLRRSERLDFLVRPPGECFPSVAVNKIIMEGCTRVPDIANYMDTLNRTGRGWITGFENQMICRILFALDEEEREPAMRENSQAPRACDSA